jgi:transcriptional regulator with XRE-family HTH domain
VSCRPNGPDLYAHDLTAKALRRLGRRLQELRRAAGLTQRDLAASSGLRAATLSALENGQQSPTRKTMTALTMALGCSPEALLAEGAGTP